MSLPRLAKSKKNALLLSSITVLSYSATSAIVNLLAPFLMTWDLRSIIADPERLNEPAEILALLIILALSFAILVAIWAYWLYRYFGEAYYGARGACRWIIFGAVLALLVRAQSWLLPETGLLLRSAWLFVSIFLAYGLARLLIPLVHPQNA